MINRPLRLDDFLPYRLSFITNMVSEQIARLYESQFGISAPEWRLIAVIAEQGNSTQNAICARTQMDKVTVSRAAISLVRRALLTRSPNLEDKRSHLLSLAPGGVDLYAQIAPKALEMEAAIFACLTVSERQKLMGLLQKLDRHILARS